jgi:hypothetical protein
MFSNIDYWKLDYFSYICKYKKTRRLGVWDPMILVGNFVKRDKGSEYFTRNKLK